MKQRHIDFALLILRVCVGLGIMTHGWAKLMKGVDVFAAGSVTEMGLPFPIVFAWAAILSELIGGFFLVLGLWTRFSALAVGTVVAVAGFVRHADDAFEKREMALLYLACAAVIFIAGAGKYAVDSSGGRGKSKAAAPAKAKK